tara:strand:+ start:1600 stop:1833 length:234 start_codon:yes stop_codon:yes gene_type:complete
VEGRGRGKGRRFEGLQEYENDSIVSTYSSHMYLEEGNVMFLIFYSTLKPRPTKWNAASFPIPLHRRQKINMKHTYII